MWTVIGDGRDQVGESPVWDKARNALWWVDTWGRTVNRLDLATDDVRRFPAPEMVGGMALAADGSVLALMETGLFQLDLETQEYKFVSAPDDLADTHRFNDVTVDPAGGLLAGTMRKSQLGAEPTGVLYHYDGKWTRLYDGFWIVNGLAVSPDGATLYVSDSHPSVRQVWSADYDVGSGQAGTRRTFVDMTDYEGRPDGATVHANGDYWVAGIGGACLYQFDPSGRLVQQHNLPVERPTKPAFVGSNLDTLFVTSMNVLLQRPDPQGLAGALLRRRL